MTETLFQEIENFMLEGEGDFWSLLERLYTEQVQHNKFLQMNSTLAKDLYPDTPAPIDVDLFKTLNLSSFEGEPQWEWRSSGTTGSRSTVGLKDSRFYDLAIDTCKKGTHFEDLLDGVRSITTLVPTTKKWPNSSLAYMFERLSKGRQVLHLVEANGQKPGDLTLRDPEIIEGFVIPTGIFTTSYMGVKLMESMDPIEMPPGSFIVDTGGYKGVVRDHSREEFVDLAMDKLGLPRENIISEYGMSEMASHFWSEMVDGRELWKIPRSVHVEILDPDENGIGQVALHDLLNVWTTTSVITSDLGEVVDGGYFIPHGRMAGAPLKGCSIVAERAYNA